MECSIDNIPSSDRNCVRRAKIAKLVGARTLNRPTSESEDKRQSFIQVDSTATRDLVSKESRRGDVDFPRNPQFHKDTITKVNPP